MIFVFINSNWQTAVRSHVIVVTYDKNVNRSQNVTV